MQSRIKQIEDYFLAFNIAENIAYIQVRFPEKWDVPSSEILEDEYSTKIVEEKDHSYYFFSNMGNGIMNVFDAVDFTIAYNKDLEEKSNLFLTKINELKEIFATKSLNELRGVRIELTSGVSETVKEDTKKNNSKRSRRSTKKDNKKEIPSDKSQTNEDVTPIVPEDAVSTEGLENETLLAFANSIIEN